MSPYARKTVTEDEHAGFVWLADVVASTSAKALAAKTMRLGKAHQYLIASHLNDLMDGMGEEAALEFIEQLVNDLTATPSLWVKP